MTNDIIQSANVFSTIGRFLLSIAGGILAILEPTVPYIIVCTIAVFLDCYSAWSLSRRVKKRFPGANDGKFKSNYAGRVFVTLIKIYAIVILAFLVDKYVLVDFSLRLPNIVAGAICFWQFWSILENESSCNDSSWAKVAQRILIDKTERHFDIDLSELKKDKEERMQSDTNDNVNGKD